MKKYWDKKGKYQKKADALAELVPTAGVADSLHIEAVRIAYNAYYDFYNNAGCNERLEELRWVYNWLEKYNIKYEAIGKVRYSKLYSEFGEQSAYVVNIAEKLEKIMDAVVKQAYKIEFGK